MANTWICEKCDATFADNQKYKQHKVDHMQGRAVEKRVDLVTGEEIKPPSKRAENKPPKPVVTKKEPSKPIKLTYVYQGNCKDCGKSVETLELDVANKHIVLAYCTPCHKQWKSREVVVL